MNKTEATPAAVRGSECNDLLGLAPKRGTVDRAEWLADKLHNTNDFGKEAAALLVHQAKELELLADKVMLKNLALMSAASLLERIDIADRGTYGDLRETAAGIAEALGA